MNEALTRDGMISWLTDRRFPLARALRASSSLGSTTTAGSAINRQKVFADAKEFEDMLRVLPDDKLVQRVQIERERDAATRRAKAEEEERKLPYNQPASSMSIEYWSRLDFWTLDEAVALSFGKDPRSVSPASMKPFAYLAGLPKAFAERREIAARAKSLSQLYDPVFPGVFIAWAQRKGIQMPQALVEAVKANGAMIADWKSLHDDIAAKHATLQQSHESQGAQLAASLKMNDEWMRLSEGLLERFKALHVEHGVELADVAKAQAEAQARADGLGAENAALRAQIAAHGAEGGDLKERERTSLFKLLFAMAREKYRYDPRKSKNSATQRIVAATEAVGLPVGEDTVRKYLQAASELADWSTIEQVD